MYSAAISTSNEKPYDLTDQLTPDDIKNINNGVVYSNSRLVFAIKHKDNKDHAELRVLKELEKKPLDGGHLLVIFSYASPCDENCANPASYFNIISRLKNVVAMKTWENYAFVFEKVFTPAGEETDKEKVETALKNIGASGIGLANIFRCYKPKNEAFVCVSCSSGGAVEKQCVDYDA